MISTTNIVRLTRLVAAAVTLAAIGSAAFAYTPEQEQMCTGDALRLCSSAVPDVDRVTACMISKRSQLSPGCAVFFRGSEPRSAIATSRSGKASAVRARKSTRPANRTKPRPH